MHSLLLDTNVLILFLIGSVAPERVGSHRRLRVFDRIDLTNVQRIAGAFERHVSVPNVLTEASNLIGSDPQEAAPGATIALANYVGFLSEIFEPSANVTEGRAYRRFGLADAVIEKVARERDVTVVTSEHALHGYLESNGVKAINIWHFRTP